MPVRVDLFLSRQWAVVKTPLRAQVATVGGREAGEAGAATTSSFPERMETRGERRVGVFSI